MADSKKLQVTLVRSLIGTPEKHKDCVRGLGLRRIRHRVSVEKTPSNMGMINKVKYLLKVEEGK